MWLALWLCSVGDADFLADRCSAFVDGERAKPVTNLDESRDGQISPGVYGVNTFQVVAEALYGAPVELGLGEERVDIRLKLETTPALRRG